MMQRAILERTHFALAMLRLSLSAGAWPTTHLCELLASVHFSGLPTVNLADLSVRAHSPVLHPVLIGGSSGAIAEMVTLAVVTAALRPKSILEIGAYDGMSAWHLWANSEANVLSVDWPSHPRPFLPKDDRVRLHEIDSRQWEPPEGQRFDLCFIDAGHEYECVRNDTEKAMSCLSAGGTIVWHDATWRRDEFGVNRYLLGLRRSGKDVRLLRISTYDCCTLAILQTEDPA
jgi:hypothetical protein